MKKIQYGIVGMTDVYNPEVGVTEKQEVICTVILPWSDENEERAKREALNGEYAIEDDGQPEPEVVTTEDVLDALLGVTSNE